MAQVTPQLVKELRERTGVGMAKCKEALDASGGDINLAIENLRKAGVASAVKKEGRETKEGVIKIADDKEKIALVEVNTETDFVAKNEKFQKFAQDLAETVLKSAPNSIGEFIQQKFDGKQTVDEYRASIIQSLGENIQIRRVELFPRKANASLAVYSHGGGKLVTLVEISGSSAENELAKEIAMHVAAESPEYLSHEEIPPRVIEHEKEIARAQIQGKPANIVEKILEGKLKAYYDQVCLVNQKFIKDTNITIAELVTKKGKERGKPLKVSYFLRWRVGE